MSTSEAAVTTSGAASTLKMIVLCSSDEQTFEIEETVALESQTIKHLVEDDCVDAIIHVPNVKGKVLAKVIECCKKHVGTVDEPKASEEDLKKFEKEFLEVEDNMLFHLLLAANYLDIKSLLDVTCQKVADNIKDLQPEEVRSIFNIKNDFTPEEEAKLRSENSWAFE